MTTKPGDLLTIVDVAELVGSTPTSLRKGAMGINQVPKIRLGGAIRYRRQDIEKWLEANTREPFRVVERARRSA